MLTIVKEKIGLIVILTYELQRALNIELIYRLWHFWILDQGDRKHNDMRCHLECRVILQEFAIKKISLVQEVLDPLHLVLFHLIGFLRLDPV